MSAEDGDQNHVEIGDVRAPPIVDPNAGDAAIEAEEREIAIAQKRCGLTKTVHLQLMIDRLTTANERLESERDQLREALSDLKGKYGRLEERHGHSRHSTSRSNKVTSTSTGAGGLLLTSAGFMADQTQGTAKNIAIAVGAALLLMSLALPWCTSSDSPPP